MIGVINKKYSNNNNNNRYTIFTTVNKLSIRTKLIHIAYFEGHKLNSSD